MTFSERFIIFVRLHFLQLLWNFKGMQHFGFLSALRPVLRRLYSGDAYIEAEKRQGQFFNTHPCFAPICVGVVARLEEELKAGTFQKAEMIPVLKNRMSGPLAAVGDAFFWETVRPIVGSCAVFAVYAFGAGAPSATLGIACFVLVYIFLVESIRWRGLGWGYAYGLGVVDLLKKKDFHSSMRTLRNVGALGLGIATVFFLAGDTEAVTWEHGARAAAMGLLLWGAMKKLSPTLMLYLLVAGGMALGMFL